MQRIVIISFLLLVGSAAIAQKHNPGFHLPDESDSLEVFFDLPEDFTTIDSVLESYQPGQLQPDYPTSMPILKPRYYVNQMKVVVPRKDVDYSLLIYPDELPRDIEIDLNDNE